MGECSGLGVGGCGLGVVGCGLWVVGLGAHLQDAGVVVTRHARPIEGGAGVHVLRLLQRQQLVEDAEEGGGLCEAGENCNNLVRHGAAVAQAQQLREGTAAAAAASAATPANRVHISRQRVPNQTVTN